MAVKKADAPEGLIIHPLKGGEITLRMIGETPLYFNAMSAKVKRTLLLGGGKKTAAEKKDIKHNPEEEFRDSVYSSEDGVTLLQFPAPGIKGAMATAALETAGVTKSSVQRLIFLPQEYIPIWGVPLLKMDVVRSADMAKTPDVRSRAFVREWAAEVTIKYVIPTLSKTAIMALLSNAGAIVGIGDFRQEKGRGSFGTFSVHGTDMTGEPKERWDRITAHGRAEQVAAMAAATPADADTRTLMDMLIEERGKRG